MNAKTTTTTSKTKARKMADAAEAIRKRLDLETLETRGLDRLDFHDISVAAIREVIQIAFDAGYAAATGTPGPVLFDPQDPGAMLDTLEITEKAERRSSGTWVRGNIAGHRFEALVFPEHAKTDSHELGDSRISKLWLRDNATKTEVANFDRGWDRQPATPAAAAIVDLLAAGLAETVFGA